MSIFVIAGTLVSLLAFFVLLHLNRHVSNPGQTTGHSYDGIEEYDNPLPAWWYWGFVAAIVFAVGYLIYYPGLGNFEGVGGWSSTGQLRAEQEIADATYGPLFAQYREMPLTEIANDPAANRMGKRLFINHCAVCHGANGGGSFGFPNLTDSEWQWGNDDADLIATITHGRNAAMLAWKDVLGADGVDAVTEYVIALSGRDADQALSARGETLFGTFCVACHGADGRGQKVFGAPDLTNDIWLYGGSRARVRYVIENGRNGVMPSFEGKLGSDKVRILAGYVKSLAGGSDE